jgi:hypothetical protein
MKFLKQAFEPEMEVDESVVDFVALVAMVVGVIGLTMIVVLNAVDLMVPVVSKKVDIVAF